MIDMIWECCDVTDTEESADGPDYFVLPATDPQGRAYSVQVNPSSSVTSPIFFAGRDPFHQGNALRLLNRVLTRLQPSPRSHTSSRLIVVRVHDLDVVYDEAVASFTAGRAQALVIAEQLRAGTFDGS